MRKFTLGLMTAVVLLAAPAAFADDPSLDGLEMDVMDANATPNDASTRVLTLPADASDRAHERAQRGLDRANAAREEHGDLDDDSQAEGATGGDHGHNNDDDQGHRSGAPDSH